MKKLIERKRLRIFKAGVICFFIVIVSAMIPQGVSLDEMSPVSYQIKNDGVISHLPQYPTNKDIQQQYLLLDLPIIVYVDNDYNASTPGWGVDHFATIQEGITGVAEGGTVNVYSGVYEEDLIIQKPLNLIGVDPDVTLANSAGMNIVSDSVVVTGFTFFNCDGGASHSAIMISSCNHTQITSCSFQSGGGILVQDSSVYTAISNCTFTNDVNYGVILWTGCANTCITYCMINDVESYGIYVSENDNTLISHCTITETVRDGIGVFLSHHTSISDCLISVTLRDRNGIQITGSYYTTITNCTITEYGIGIKLSYYNNLETRYTTITRCTLMSNGVGVSISSSRYNTVAESLIVDNGQAIDITGDMNRISNNVIHNGLQIGSSFNIVEDNTISESTIGIFLRYSAYNNTITGNIITDNQHGIDLQDQAHQNTINGNSITDNNIGIYLSSSYENIIAGNSIQQNHIRGVYLLSTSYANHFYHNNFITNTYHAYDPGNNTWYNTEFEEGNYWDDYTGNDSNGDGIGDTPYNISGRTPPNQDLYPLMNPYSPPLFSIVSSNPSSGAIDARKPHDPDNTHNKYGWNSVEITFDGDVSGLIPADFTTSEIGGDGFAPWVVSVTPISENTVTVVLSDKIEPAAWTEVTYIGSGTSVHLGYLPGDVDGSGTSNTNDVIALIDSLNGIAPRPDYSTNIDRSGTSNLNDLIELIDLLNGAAEYEPWIMVSLPPYP